MSTDIIPVPEGFSFAVAAAGFKYQGRDDLALIVSDRPASAAGVFTRNLFQAAPVIVAAEALKASQTARALLINAGQANACTGRDGIVNCRETLKLAAKATGLKTGEILPASTGVIGPQLNMDAWKKALPELAANLGKSGPIETAKAIMTTDTFPKLAWGSVSLGKKQARILGMAKGAGMICPDMATLIGLVVTDAEVDPDWWREALASAVDQSFNSITVDGDTSTNDCVLALANGASGLSTQSKQGRLALAGALAEVCQALAFMIVQDAEGGTKILRVQVVGTEDNLQAEQAARAVGHSPLVKTAFFGEDANWGRIVAALGRSGAQFDPDKASLAIGGITVFARGVPAAGDLDSLLAPIMRRKEIAVTVNLGEGPGEYVLLASDLTHEYVNINADYRS
ncbi:MAG: bifunctional glutamate N-acetyltransferase/amino-acid acetyltransferase ArgJ [Desulfovibrionaceae bacterium]|nr:bifunctional glutamate N-acetyltransferase/amino-acid acetyltransferase ArgJ [Desulfovibrionaceae bacterium]MBF0514028.1 bifunctional glutamate N-acetyltransferase/amino-acid acetyltransferase ArgJ [Desulfovibrionaceae bacterium]